MKLKKRFDKRKAIAYSEMFLLISMSFAFAVILNAELGDSVETNHSFNGVTVNDIMQNPTAVPTPSSSVASSQLASGITIYNQQSGIINIYSASNGQAQQVSGTGASTSTFAAPQVAATQPATLSPTQSPIPPNPSTPAAAVINPSVAGSYNSIGVLGADGRVAIADVKGVAVNNLDGSKSVLLGTDSQGNLKAYEGVVDSSNKWQGWQEAQGTDNARLWNAMKNDQSLVNSLPANTDPSVLRQLGYTEQRGFGTATGNIDKNGLLSPDRQHLISDGTKYNWDATQNGGKGNWVPAAGTASSEYSGKLFGVMDVKGAFLGRMADATTYAVAIAGAIQLLGPLFGAKKGMTNSLSLAAVGGIYAWKGAQYLISQQIGEGAAMDASLSQFGGLTGNQLAAGIGIGVAAAIFILTYKTEKKQIVTYECLPYQPPTGGAKCEQCNKDVFRPCTEYRCKSLGQACQLLNAGTSEANCAWVNPKDVNSPTIEPWNDALKPAKDKLKYTPDNAIRPPNRGVKIVKDNNGCLQPYTPLEFGIITNEPAQCKIDYNHTSSFANMTYFFGETNYFLYNHTEKLKLPGPYTGTDGDLSPILSNDGTFGLYVRCMDANGNENVDEFVFNFCVDKSPDTTPPVIDGTSINNNGYVTYGIGSVPIAVYVNEPATCKWSRTDKSYDDMENGMNCGTQTYEINGNLDYVCTSNLTAIQDRADNKFYFRCKDQPNKAENERNVNVQSYALNLKGSQTLNIVKIKPNETISSNTDTAKVELFVETANGAEEGKAACYFDDQYSGEYIPMFETNNYQSKQSLDLTAGNYQYFFRCIDSGGNTAESNTTFKVAIDKQAPQITRVYKDNALKIVTDEDAQCVYSLKDCNYEFKDGVAMIYSNPSIQTSLFAEWKSNVVYYIKCKDKYDNQPVSNQCSIIARAVDLAGSGTSS